MSKYKVGDVAALFSKSKTPNTEAGKKLNALFSEFHSKKNNSQTQSCKKVAKSKENQNIEKRKEETGIQNVSNKNKKRKFSAVTNPESNIEQIEENTKKFKGANVAKDFPRKKKKSSKTNAFDFDSSDFNRFETDENPSDNEQDTNAIFKSKNKSKLNKNVSGFIKKSKHQMQAITNGTVENRDNKKYKKLCHEEEFDSDVSLKNEIEKFVKTAKKLKGKKSNDDKFIRSSQSNLVNANCTIKKQDNKKLSIKEEFNNDTLFKSKTVEFGKKVAKKLKKSSNSNFVPNFQFKHGVANNKVEAQNNAELKEMKSEEAFDNSNVLFKSEVEEFVQKNLKKRINAINFIRNSRPKVHKQSYPDYIKLSSRKPEEDEEKLKCTLFIGNLPVNTNKKALRTLFSPFGEIENIRYNGIETDKAKLFSEDHSKLLTATNYAADSVPGFIVFKERKSAVDALSLSGSLFKNHHITVDFAMPAGTKKLYDDKRSIFIGNLSFDIKDESIWEAFSDCGRIEGVRIVRDRNTGIGKGFGYVLFSTVQAKENALALENVEIQGRTIRIKAIDSNRDTKKSNNTHPVKRDTFKSQAIRLKKKNKGSGSRKSIKKIMKKQKNIHQKKKIANVLQKAMK